jgi:hemoglobin-like flavoprotein
MDEFYSRLFKRAPAVVPLFANVDLRRQKAMLLGTLGLLRRSLHSPERIIPRLQVLGARHVGYGARPEHYPIVGETLIETMRKVAGPPWSPEHETAWQQMFAIVAAAMLDGANKAELDVAA